MSSLDGRWKQTAYIPNGTTVEDAGWYWEFDLSEGRYRVFGSPTSQAAANAGTLRVDSEVKPATITLSPLIANGPTQGIFKIEGEVLVIALAEDVPSDFEPSDGKHIYRFELQKKSD